MPARTTTNDAIQAALKKTLKGLQDAERDAREDTRTSSTELTDHLNAALKELYAAQQWYSGLVAEEHRNEREVIKPPAKPKSEPKPVCHICENEVAPGDVAVCGGCDEITCPNCMDEEVCQNCKSEEDE